ncbi:MAG: hypothetical protein M3381_06510 [Actinomycetota bacterium]|nr:hypothetical protein [Actinomycetota bacterium]
MPTPDLFAFDVDRLADYDPERVRQALRQHPAVYVNHLQIAQWLQQWAEGLDDSSQGGIHDHAQAASGIREAAAHLRQADLVPDGPLLVEMDEAQERDLRQAHRGSAY